MNSNSVKMSDVCKFLVERIGQDPLLKLYSEHDGFQVKQFQNALDESKKEDDRWFSYLYFENKRSSCNIRIGETRDTSQSNYAKDKAGHTWSRSRLTFEVQWPSHGSDNDPKTAERRLDLYRRVVDLALAAQNQFEGQDVWKLVE